MPLLTASEPTNTNPLSSIHIDELAAYTDPSISSSALPIGNSTSSGSSLSEAANAFDLAVPKSRQSVQSDAGDATRLAASAFSSTREPPGGDVRSSRGTLGRSGGLPARGTWSASSSSRRRASRSSSDTTPRNCGRSASASASSLSSRLLNSRTAASGVMPILRLPPRPLLAGEKRARRPPSGRPAARRLHLRAPQSDAAGARAYCGPQWC